MTNLMVGLDERIANRPATVAHVRGLFRSLGVHLRGIEDRTGDLGLEARRAWMFSVMSITTAAQLAELLAFAEKLQWATTNWKDSMSTSAGRRTEKDETFEREVMEPAGIAAEAALGALLMLVDEVRESYPAELQ